MGERVKLLLLPFILLSCVQKGGPWLELRVEDSTCVSTVKLPLKPISRMLSSLPQETKDSIRLSLMETVKSKVIYRSEGYEDMLSSLVDYLLDGKDLPGRVYGKRYVIRYLKDGDTVGFYVRISKGEYKAGSLIVISGDGTEVKIPVGVAKAFLSLSNTLFGDSVLIEGFGRFRLSDLGKILVVGFEVSNVCKGDTSVLLVR